MNIASVTSSSAASQASSVSQVQQNSGAGGAGPAHRPPPPPDGGALLGAVADALQSIGVTATGAADDGSATASTDGAGTNTQGNAAQALSSFLHELMGALHQQGAGGQGGQPPDGQAYGPPGGGSGGPGGPGGPGGGPGRLAADLQSLISKLGSSSTDGSESTGGTGSTEGTDSTASATDSASTTLESAFENLLQALGSDTSGAGGKLASFLQTLADKLPGAGSSGNLINTSV
ncbi:hypothetical protein GJ700_23700 [Duganella sp. FT92W]|uniref:Uncharacterized protein n=1 Tax=Pseudoduganella rivuli TaxID=2666085 RepID=A0A7X2IRA1_9BURK|nr:hypothetical protein [Pseudoduganella rivuli]MRV74721.1 hypothetical protein [Pseudoduganella rivuli]